jgi:transposase
MASLYPKKIGGRTYWYLREMARVDGKPKMVSERYVGTAADIEAMLNARESATLPERTRHLAFGDVAAAWGILQDLGVAGIIDAQAGPRRPGQPLSAGTYLALAALNRLVAPCSKAGFADWWKTTAADRFTKVPASALDHRRFWDAMHAVTPQQLEQASEKIAAAIIRAAGVDVSSVALDMTNFATFIATGNRKAPIAQRGKAKQKRTDLRLVGLGLVVTRDGGIPLTWRAYPGDRPDVTQFPVMASQLKARYEAVCAAAGLDLAAPDITVVFDAGQNSEANLAHFAETDMHYIGSVPASDCPDLLALPASKRTTVDKDRFGGLTAFDTRRTAYGAERRAILTHSPELHEAQAAGFAGTTLAKTGKKLDELAGKLARGKTCRSRDKVEAEIASIISAAWVRRVVRWELAGGEPRDFRLAWEIDEQARAALEEEIFGKHVLITSHDDWPVPEVVAGYRSQSEAEFSFRQMKDPHVVSFSPMHHWTEHSIRVHVFTCVLALQIAHLMRLRARRAGLDLSVRDLLGQLAAIGETVLVYPSTGGRPKARRMTTELISDQPALHDIFGLQRWAPAALGPHAKTSSRESLAAETPGRSTTIGNSGSALSPAGRKAFERGAALWDHGRHGRAGGILRARLGPPDGCVRPVGHGRGAVARAQRARPAAGRPRDLAAGRQSDAGGEVAHEVRAVRRVRRSRQRRCRRCPGRVPRRRLDRAGRRLGTPAGDLPRGR